jgi:hypothetical protein
MTKHNNRAGRDHLSKQTKIHGIEMQGTSLSWCRHRSAIGVGVWWYVEGVNTAERSGMVVAQVYLASDPAIVARPYVLL